MKSLLICLLAISPLNAGEVVGSFHSIGIPDQDSTTQRLDYIERTMGIAHYWFQYALSGDKKLVASLKTEVDGKILAAGSGIYHIAPRANSQNHERCINISVRSAQLFGQQLRDKAIFDINLSDAYRFSFAVPRESFEGSQEMHQEPIDALELSTDYVAWTYVVHDPAGKERFRATLTVRAEPVDAADKPGLVRKIQ